MAGIAGFFHLKEAEEHSFESGVCIGKMLEAMRHRGQSISGEYHNKKAYIAFQGKQIEFKQPISNEDKTLWVACDGRIYNHEELKHLLRPLDHKFSTNTDTEVLIHLYEEKEASFFDAVNGEFSAVIYDARKQKLFLVRDHLGMRSLYYTILYDTIYFASEIKALLTLPDVIREIDPKAVLDFLALGEVLGEKTLLKSVKRVEPGSFLEIDQHNKLMRRYWDPFDFLFGESKIVDKIYALKIFKQKLREAIRRRVRDLEPPVNSYLSGGIDSTLVTAMIKDETKGSLETFSIIFGEGQYDETPYALEASKKIGTAHHLKRITSKEYARILRDAIWYGEEIRGGDCCVPYYLAAQLVGDYGKVVFSGEGGDELHGYPYQLDLKAAHIIYELLHYAKFNRDDASELAAWVKSSARKPKQVLHGFLAGLFPVSIQKWGFILLGARSTVLTLADKRFLAKIKNYWPQKLPSKFVSYADPFDVDRYYEVAVVLSNRARTEGGYHEAYSIEIRYPLMDREVVEVSLKMSPSVIMQSMQTKYVMRKVLEELSIPKFITQRPKVGFTIPFQTWYRDDLQAFAAEILLDERTLNRKVYRRKFIKDMLRAHFSGKKDYGGLIGSLINLELWFRLFIDRDMNVAST